MKKIIFLLILVSNVAFCESFKIGGKEYELANQNGLLLFGCEKSCEALKVIKASKKIDLTKLRKGQPYANSVGSDACSLAYKANALIGINSQGDQRAFCLFKDESMVEMNSLSQHLEEKNIIR